MPRRISVVPTTVVLGLLLAMVTLAACGGPRTTSQGASFVGSDGSAVVIDVKDREPVPAISAPLLGGGTSALSSMRGDVVVINVWGSWCAPCRGEAASLEQVSRDFTGRGVRFIGVDTRDQTAAALAFVRHYRISYPSWVDQDGQVLLDLRTFLPADFPPSTLIVDRSGRVAARVIGPTSYTQLRSLVATVAATP
jgi:thiol-disulfide isomerase/thioredoxin